MEIRRSKIREEMNLLRVVNHVLSKFCTKRRTEVYVPLTIYIKASIEIGYRSENHLHMAASDNAEDVLNVLSFPLQKPWSSL